MAKLVVKQSAKAHGALVLVLLDLSTEAFSSHVLFVVRIRS